MGDEMDRIEEIKERLGAVEQRWSCHEEGKCCGQVWATEYPVAEVTRGEWGDDYPALKVEQGTSIEARIQIKAVMEQITYGRISDELAAANLRFIAHAPEDIAFLLSEIERLRGAA